MVGGRGRGRELQAEGTARAQALWARELCGQGQGWCGRRGVSRRQRWGQTRPVRQAL